MDWITTLIDTQERSHREYGQLPSPKAAYGAHGPKNQRDYRCLVASLALSSINRLVQDYRRIPYYDAWKLEQRYGPAPPTTCLEKKG